MLKLGLGAQTKPLPYLRANKFEEPGLQWERFRRQLSMADVGSCPGLLTQAPNLGPEMQSSSAFFTVCLRCQECRDQYGWQIHTALGGRSCFAAEFTD